MVRKEYLVITSIDKFIIYDMKSWESYELKLPYTPAPNIPFYHYLWEKDVQDMKSLMPSGVDTKGLLGASFVILMPDDALQADEKMICEFFMQSGGKKITKLKQCCLMADWKSPYICLSETCRLVVLSYIEAGEVKAQNFYDKDTFDMSSLSEYISLLHQNCRDNTLPIYINKLWENSLTLDSAANISLDDMLIRCNSLEI
jgi:hypothetical protein